MRTKTVVEKAIKDITEEMALVESEIKNYFYNSIDPENSALILESDDLETLIKMGELAKEYKTLRIEKQQISNLFPEVK